MNRGRERLSFSKEEEFYPLFLDYRILYIPASQSNIPFFDTRFEERGRSFIEGHLFSPDYLP